ncbi:uncharacterized protein LOC131851563 [Achroia grisella]|uniref:uncharacterized protein LOC131851563 n=1 Tax=Achroia grisella TaxID=688607 RepID=UPI0027D28BEB|nr:uncharacterized protein LOC131851563 [Achroia grisella]
MELERKFCNNILEDKGKINKSDQNTISLPLKEALNSIIHKEKYTTYELSTRNVALDGGNFLATLITADIKGKTKDGAKEINIFIKNIIRGDFISYLSISDVYLRELFAHNELLKIYSKLQEEAAVPLEERFNTVKCYEESSSDFIILDNLENQGFTTVDRLEPVSLNFAEISVKQLAKFHALSFVLKKMMPEYFREKVKPLKMVMNYDDKDWKMLVRNFSYVSINNTEDDNIKKKLEDLIPITLKKLPEYYLNTSVECLCHGDYRSTNLMVKINNGEVTKLIAIDYQFMYCGNPLNDLMFYIFTATDQQFRERHLEYIKNLYHDTMTTFLKYFDIDVEDYYPRRDYERLYKERLDFGLMSSIWVLPLTLAPGEDAPDFSKTAPCNIQLKVHSNFKSRWNGIVNDYTKWGYL